MWCWLWLCCSSPPGLPKPSDSREFWLLLWHDDDKVPKLSTLCRSWPVMTSSSRMSVSLSRGCGSPLMCTCAGTTCWTPTLAPSSVISSSDGSSRPKPLRRRFSWTFSCWLGPWLALTEVVVVVVVVALATGVGLSAHREVLDKPESLLTERAWSLWSGLEVAEVVRGPWASATFPLVGLLLFAVLSCVRPWDRGAAKQKRCSASYSQLVWAHTETHKQQRRTNGTRNHRQEKTLLTRRLATDAKHSRLTWPWQQRLQHRVQEERDVTYNTELRQAIKLDVLGKKCNVM